jgi:hypothetical protein
MASYSTTYIRYRGRLIQVDLRYGSYMSAHVLCGKPLALPTSDWDESCEAKRFLRFLYHNRGKKLGNPQKVRDILTGRYRRRHNTPRKKCRRDE